MGKMELFWAHSLQLGIRDSGFGIQKSYSGFERWRIEMQPKMEPLTKTTNPNIAFTIARYCVYLFQSILPGTVVWFRHVYAEVTEIDYTENTIYANF